MSKKTGAAALIKYKFLSNPNFVLAEFLIDNPDIFKEIKAYASTQKILELQNEELLNARNSGKLSAVNRLKSERGNSDQKPSL